MSLSLFVYGSLRPGQCNFGQLSEFVLESQTVVWPGQLRLRPEGYPALVLPTEMVQRPGQLYDWETPWAVPPVHLPGGLILGEVLRLQDSPRLRRRLDDFEGFSEDPPEYLRVAVPWQGRWVWTYVAPSPCPEWSVIASWPPPEGVPGPWKGPFPN